MRHTLVPVLAGALLAAACAAGEGAAPAGRPYVVLVSADGFRHDYLARGRMPTLSALAEGGARAEALIPIFPTKTFPNHHAIITGLHADRHRLASNHFYDPELDEYYRMSVVDGRPRADQTNVGQGRWYGGEPLWVTAARQGVRSATMFWPGSDADIGGVRPVRWKAYDHFFPDTQRVDSVLTWLALPPEERPHFLTLYFALMDDAGQGGGPEGAAVDSALTVLDGLLGRLVEGIGALPHGDSVAVVFVSDHGMMTADRGVAFTGTPPEPGPHAVAVVSEPLVHYWFRGDTAALERVEAELRAGLTHATVYRRSELPEAWRIRDEPRIGDLLVVAEPGYRTGLAGSGGPPALHGYDPSTPEMGGVFVAWGFGIAPGTRLGRVPNVDVYPFVAALLGLEDLPPVDGNLAILGAALAAPGR